MIIRTDELLVVLVLNDRSKLRVYASGLDDSNSICIHSQKGLVYYYFYFNMQKQTQGLYAYIPVHFGCIFSGIFKYQSYILY